MSEELPDTPYFNLTRVGSGESISKNGYSFQDLDRLKLDALLYAAFNHRHDGIPALGDPTDQALLTPQPSGGELPAATTYYYRVSYVDTNGLESAASPEASVTTPSPVAAPTPPAATVIATGGTVSPGVYSYLLTLTDAYGGETTPSSLNNVQVTSGTTNQIRLDLPQITDSNAVGYRIYRARPGQSSFYQIGTTTTSPFYDTGIAEDQTIQAPSVNSTNAFNSIDVTIPFGVIPDGCASWKIYRSTTSGDYDGTSLVHHVIEGATSTSIIPLTVWTDVGDALEAGFPQETSATVPPSPVLGATTTVAGGAITGTLPAASLPAGTQVLSVYCAGTPTDGRVISVTESLYDSTPVRFTAHFQTPPGAETVTFTVADGSGHSVDLPCSSSTHVAGDNAGYFHVEQPVVQSGSWEAETGTRSDTGTVPIVNDSSCPSGVAVELDAQNEWVEVDIGTLDSGSYTAYGTVRVVTVASSSTNDLEIAVVRSDTSAVVASTAFTLTSAAPFAELTGPTFTAPGGVDYLIRVTKKTATAQSYNVDKMRFSAGVASLDAGTLTVTSAVSGGTTASADVNLAIWF